MKMELVLGIAFGLSTSSCIKQGSVGGPTGDGARLVSVSMKMPTKIGDKDVTGKMDGYHLVISKSGGDCAFTDVDRTEKVAAGDVKIDASLKQKCSYLILLSFGKMSSDGKTLERIFLTNDKHDNKPGNPASVQQANLDGKNSITIPACVNVTELGSKELGVSQLECPSVADSSIDATIEPIIMNDTNDIKLTSPISQSVQGANLLLSAEAVTASAETQYCALSFEIQFAGNTTTIRELAGDSIFEFKVQDKKQLSKTIDIKQITDQGPYQISSVKLLKACQTSKPEPTVTAKQLIDSCSAVKTCKEATP